MSALLPPDASLIQAAIEAEVKARVKAAIETISKEATENLEASLRGEVANIVMRLSHYYEVETMRDRIVITVRDIRDGR